MNLSEYLKYAKYIQAWAIFLLLLIVARRPELVDEVLNEIVAKIIKIIRIIFNHILTGGKKR